jgi:hypothetical protein
MAVACSKATRYTFRITTPNIVVEALKLLSRFREVPDSNLGPETAILSSFRGFLSPFKQMPRKYLKIRPRPLSYKPFLINHSLHHFIQSGIVLGTERQYLNKPQINKNK